MYDDETLQELTRFSAARNLDASFFAVLSNEDTSLENLPSHFIALDSESESRMDFSRRAQIDDEYKYISDQHFEAVAKRLSNAEIRFSVLRESDSLETFLFETLPSLGIFAV
jgi:hypothetical protein